MGFKSLKNQKYFKNYFIKESTSASPSTTYNFCGRGGHISSTCPLRNGSQKNLNVKAKKIWVKNPRSLTIKDAKRYGYLNKLKLYVVEFKKG